MTSKAKTSNFISCAYIAVPMCNSFNWQITLSINQTELVKSWQCQLATLLLVKHDSKHKSAVSVYLLALVG